MEIDVIDISGNAVICQCFLDTKYNFGLTTSQKVYATEYDGSISRQLLSTSLVFSLPPPYSFLLAAWWIWKQRQHKKTIRTVSFQLLACWKHRQLLSALYRTTCCPFCVVQLFRCVLIVALGWSQTQKSVKFAPMDFFYFSLQRCAHSCVSVNGRNAVTWRIYGIAFQFLQISFNRNFRRNMWRRFNDSGQTRRGTTTYIP